MTLVPPTGATKPVREVDHGEQTDGMATTRGGWLLRVLLLEKVV